MGTITWHKMLMVSNFYNTVFSAYRRYANTFFENFTSLLDHIPFSGFRSLP
jgi:hypothetical protein